MNTSTGFFQEMVDPLEKMEGDFIIRAEHLGRYLFASRYLSKIKASLVYDIACGNGYGTRILAPVCKHVIGFDRSKEYLSTAQKIYPLKNGSYQQLNLDQEIPPSGADVIISFETIEHLIDPQKFLSHCAFALSPHGSLILSVPNQQFEPKKKGRSRNKYHLHLFTKERIINLLQQENFLIEGVYGQWKTNFLQHKMKHTIPFIESYIGSDLSRLQQITQLVAFPTKFYSNFSYSIIIIARKK